MPAVHVYRSIRSLRDCTGTINVAYNSVLYMLNTVDSVLNCRFQASASMINESMTPREAPCTMTVDNMQDTSFSCSKLQAVMYEAGDYGKPLFMYNCIIQTTGLSLTACA